MWQEHAEPACAWDGSLLPQQRDEKGLGAPFAQWWGPGGREPACSHLRQGLLCAGTTVGRWALEGSAKASTRGRASSEACQARELQPSPSDKGSLPPASPPTRHRGPAWVPGASCLRGGRGRRTRGGGKAASHPSLPSHLQARGDGGGGWRTSLNEDEMVDQNI